MITGPGLDGVEVQIDTTPPTPQQPRHIVYPNGWMPIYMRNTGIQITQWVNTGQKDVDGSNIWTCKIEKRKPHGE